MANIDAADDGVIEDLIETASRYIDNQTGRTFYARGTALAPEDRYFSVPRDGNKRWLWLDDDLLQVVEITNGDGVVVAAADYYLMPRNETPKYAIVLKHYSGEYWKINDDGDYEYVIEVSGIWGYNATGSHPADIQTACLMIASSLYKRRFGENMSSITTVTGAGVVITPQDVPKEAAYILDSYKRLVK
jgi:hypothetical protein